MELIEAWNKYGFTGRFYDVVEELGLDYTKAEVEAFVKDQGEHEIYQRTKGPIKNFVHFPQYQNNYDRYQIDVLYLASARSTKKVLCLNCLIVRSRYLMSRPIKSTNSQEVWSAFEDMILTDCKEWPTALQADAGKEFDNKLFRDNLKTKRCPNGRPSHLIINTPYMKNENSYVERVNATISLPFYERMKKIELNTGRVNYDWQPYLADTVWAYNHKVHSATDERPVNLQFHNAEPKKKEYKDIPPGKLKVGDVVRKFIGNRMDRDRHVSPNWSEKTFIIYKSTKRGKTNPTQYYLSEGYEKGDTDDKFYYEEDLLLNTGHTNIDYLPVIEKENVQRQHIPKMTRSGNIREI